MAILTTTVDAIFEYNLSPQEFEAYQLALIWDAEIRRIFPGQFPSGIPKRGNPCKSTLFKACWKTLRETRGILDPTDWRLYVIANIQGVHKFGGRIAPNIMWGDKAWVRWKIFKRAYDKKLAEITNKPLTAPTTDPKIMRELDRTRKFLHEKCEGTPSLEKINEFARNKKIKLWLTQGKITPFYLFLSKHMKPHSDQIAKECLIDPKVYVDQIRADVVTYFEHEFKYEST